MALFDLESATDEELKSAAIDIGFAPRLSQPAGMTEKSLLPDLTSEIYPEQPVREIQTDTGTQLLGSQVIDSGVGKVDPTGFITVAEQESSVLIPKVGTVNSSVQKYLDTGVHQGKFSSVNDAVAHALHLHNMRKNKYSVSGIPETRAVDSKLVVENLPPQKKADPKFVKRMETAVLVANTMGIPLQNAFTNLDAILKGDFGKIVKERDTALTGAIGDAIQFYADAANALDDKDNADWLKEVGVKMSNSAVLPQSPEEFEPKDLLSPDWWATTGVRGVASSLFLMPAGMLAAWGSSSAVVAAGATSGGVVSFMAALTGGTYFGALFESLGESEAEKQLALSRGASLDDAELRAKFVFDKNMGVLIGSQGVQTGALLVPLFSKLPGVAKIAGPLMSRWGQTMIGKVAGKTALIATRTAIGAGANVYEEIRQGQISDIAEGDRRSFLDPKYRQGAYIAGILGVGIQVSSEGAGSLLKKMYSRTSDDPTFDATDKDGNKIGEVSPPVRSDEAEAIYRAVYDDIKEQGFSHDVADAQAENALIQTDVGQAHFKEVFEWQQEVMEKDVQQNISDIADSQFQVFPEKDVESAILEADVSRDINVAATMAESDTRTATWGDRVNRFGQKVSDIATRHGITVDELESRFTKNGLTLNDPVVLETMMATQPFAESVDMMAGLAQGSVSEILRSVRDLSKALVGIGYDLNINVLKSDEMTAIAGENRSGATVINRGDATANLLSSSESESHGVNVETFAHETIHAVTTGIMSAVRKLSPAERGATPVSRAASDLINLFRNVKKVHDEAVAQGNLSEAERALEGTNAFDSPAELLAWALTNDDMQRHLSETSFGKDSAFRKMFKNIMKMFGFNPKVQSDLKEILGISDALLGKDLTAQELADHAGIVSVDTQSSFVLARRKEETAAQMSAKGFDKEDIDKTINGIDEEMTDAEFEAFLARQEQESFEGIVDRDRKQALRELISKKRLGNVETLRMLLGLPKWEDMTDIQRHEYMKTVEQVPDKTVYLTRRVIDVVHALYKKAPKNSIVTQEHVRKMFAKEMGVKLKDLPKLFGDRTNWMTPDTFLMKKHPVFGYILRGMHEAMLEGEARHLDVLEEFKRLYKASEESRFDKTLWDHVVPIDRTVYDYMVAEKKADRNDLSQRMTPEQLDLANFMMEYFSEALEYLLQVKTLQKGIENYFVHIQKSFMENVRSDGLKTAFAKMLESSRETNLLGDIDSGEITQPRVSTFFRFALHRAGTLDPTMNIGKAFMAYSRAIEKKRAMDNVLPYIELYLNSITQKSYSYIGKGIDEHVEKFIQSLIHSKQGKKYTFGEEGDFLHIKQGGKIDAALRFGVTLTTIRDLAFNLTGNIAAPVGDLASNYIMLGKEKWALGLTRRVTKDGSALIEKYKNFTRRTIAEEFAEPGAEGPEKLFSLAMAGFHSGMVFANEQFLLGSVTEKELADGEITIERLAAMQERMGQMRHIPAFSSVVGATSLGGSFLQYKRWAAAMTLTVQRDIRKFVADMREKPYHEALKTEEAARLLAIVELSAAVWFVSSLIEEQDDGRLLKKLKRKVTREAQSITGSLNPALWMTAGRSASMATEIGLGLSRLPDQYKTDRGERVLGINSIGLTQLGRTLTPQAISQF